MSNINSLLFNVLMINVTVFVNSKNIKILEFIYIQTFLKIHKARKRVNMSDNESSDHKEISLEHRDNNGWTPLHHAVNNNSINDVQIFLSQITIEQIRYETWDGKTALFLACSKDDVSIKIVTMLLKKDPELVLYVTNNDVSPLQRACTAKRLDIVKMLLDHGAPINHCDIFAETALFYAIRQEDNIEIILCLALTSGCDLHYQNCLGYDVIVLYIVMHFTVLFGQHYNYWNEFQKNKNMCDDIVIQTIAQLRNDDDPWKCIVFTDFYNVFVDQHYNVMEKIPRFLRVFVYVFKESMPVFKKHLSDINYRSFFINAMKEVFVFTTQATHQPQTWYRQDCGPFGYFGMFYHIYAMDASVFEDIFYSLMADGYKLNNETELILELVSDPDCYGTTDELLVTLLKYFVPFGLSIQHIESFLKEYKEDCIFLYLCGRRIYGNYSYCHGRMHIFLPFVTTKQILYHNYANEWDMVPMLQSLCRAAIRNQLFSDGSSEGVKYQRLINIPVPKKIKNYLRFNHFNVDL